LSISGDPEKSDAVISSYQNTPDCSSHQRSA